MLTLPITPGTPYRTLSDRPVRVYATDGCEGREVHGAYFDGRWMACSWSIDGRFIGDCGCILDLMDAGPEATYPEHQVAEHPANEPALVMSAIVEATHS